MRMREREREREGEKNDLASQVLFVLVEKRIGREK